MARPAIELFGQTPEGQTVHRVRLDNGTLSAAILTWGAVVQDLRLDGHEPPLVLGFGRFEDYPAHSPYFGAIAGRYANRIRDGHVEIDGQTYQLDRNFLGIHHLHGGSKGIGKRIWRIANHGADFIRLEIECRAGEMGYPGRCRIGCTYRLEDGELCVVLDGETDASTLLNPAHHSYFNLEDGGLTDCLSHRLELQADYYTPVDAELIPTGVKAVSGTAHDFRVPRLIRALDDDGAVIAYDENFCVSDARRALTEVARVDAPRSGVSMVVRTTEPGVQFYSGSKLGGRPADGLIGQPYENFAGFCLEPQVWPDSPHHPDWPQAVLTPDHPYRQETRYGFRLSA